MAELESLHSRLRLDASGFQAGLRGAQEAMSGFRSRMTDVGERVQAFGANLRHVGSLMTAAFTVPILAGFGKTIMSASDLNEAIDATNAVYGESADGILKWSKSTANNLGISREAALSAAVGFGGLGKAAGYTGNDLNDFSTDIIQAGADLGSFYNVDPGTVLEDLRSGLSGESEPLRKYNIYLNEATVAQKAMAMTGKTAADQLTEGEKIAARAALILENMGDAQGNVAKTSKSFANQLRFLRARIVDLSAKIGQKLLPIALKLVDVFGKVMDKLEQLSPRMQTLIVVGAAIVAAIGPVLLILGQLATGFGVLLTVINPITLALAALGIAYATNLFGFRDAVNSVVGSVVSFGKTLAEAFSEGAKVSDLVRRFPKILQEFAGGFLLVADAAGDLVSAFRSGGLSGLLSALPGELSQIWDGLKNIGSGFVNLVIDGAVALGPKLLEIAGDFGGWLWGQLKGAWGGLFPPGTFTLDGALKLAGDLYDASLDLAGWVWKHLIRTGNFTLPVALFNLAAKIGLIDPKRTFSQFARDVAKGAADAIVNLATMGADLAKPIVDKLKTINWGQFITSDSFNFGESLGVAVRGAIGKAAGLAKEIGGGIVDVLKKIPDLSVDDLTHVATAVLKGLAAAIVAPIGMGVAIVSAIAGFFKGLIFGENDVDMTKIATTVLTALGSAIRKAAETAVTVISDIATALKNAVTVDNFVDLASAIASAIWEGLKDWFSGKSIADLFGGGSDDGKGKPPPYGEGGASYYPFTGNTGMGGKGLSPGAFAKLAAPDTSELIAAFADVAAKVTATETAVTTALANMKSRGTSHLTELASNAVRQTTTMQVGVQQSVQTMQQSATQAFNTLRTNATNAIGSLASTVSSRISDAAQTVTGRARSMQSSVVSEFGRMRDRVADTLQSLVDRVRDLSGSLNSAGADAVQGLINGVNGQIGSLRAAIDEIIAQFQRIPKQGNSPWPMMIGAGQDAVDGLVVGAESRLGRLGAVVGKAIRTFDVAPSFAAMPAVGGMAGAGGGAIGGTTNTFGDIYITVPDAGDPDKTADRVFSKFAREFGLKEG